MSSTFSRIVAVLAQFGGLPLTKCLRSAQRWRTFVRLQLIHQELDGFFIVLGATPGPIYTSPIRPRLRESLLSADATKRRFYTLHATKLFRSICTRGILEKRIRESLDRNE
jgi:hypothetical protein